MLRPSPDVNIKYLNVKDPFNKKLYNLDDETRVKTSLG